VPGVRALRTGSEETGDRAGACAAAPGLQPRGAEVVPQHVRAETCAAAWRRLPRARGRWQDSRRRLRAIACRAPPRLRTPGSRAVAIGLGLLLVRAPF